MMSQRSANAVSGKTARACDSCLRRRARWYCAADDAFLCQACDSSVHSANPLARRHDRVRLKTASSPLPLPPPPLDLNDALPSWHQGFKRKARTPRHGKNTMAMVSKPVLLVPDLEKNACDNINEDEDEHEEEEEQLLYQVPIFDPVLSEFCSPPVAFDETNSVLMEEAKPMVNDHMLTHGDHNQSHGFPEFNPSDAELAEFAADVESLLGQGLDDDSFCIDGLGLLDAKENDDKSQVKMELTDAIDTSGGIIGGDGGNANFLVDMEMEFSRESLDFNFDCGSTPEEEQTVVTTEERNRPTNVGLKLDYEAVIAAWSGRDCSPWTDGERPQFNLDDCWPEFMNMWGILGGVQGAYGEVGLLGHAGNGDNGREARVTRYREKRRTRLFSKKIRYEVRKLNAEKRPRMKGRFVKRASASFPAAAVATGGPGNFQYV